MDRIWLEAPLPALRVRTQVHGVDLHDLGRAARAGLAGGRSSMPALVGTVAVTCTRIDLSDGHLVWLSEASVGPTASQHATEFLDRALVLAGISVWRIDLGSRRIFFNAVGFRVMGMNEDANGIDLEFMRSTIHPADRQAVERAAEEALQGHGVVDVVARYRNPDGSWRTLLTRRVAERDGTGRATGLAGISLDLSRQLADRERAEVLDERTRLIVQALGVGFSRRDLDTDEAEWDEAMCRIYGIDPAAGPFSGSDWLQRCVHVQDQERIARRIRESDHRGDEVSESEFRIPDRDGQERWVHTWVRRISRGGRRMAYGMHLDVTERRRAEALLRQQQRLEQASRERSAFMARMSHELRTPMNAVLGFTQLLADDPADPLSPRQRERLAHIDSAGREMMSLIDGLLSIARQGPDPTPTPPPRAAGVLRVLCVEDNPVNLQLVRELLALRPAVRLETAVDGQTGLAAALADPPDLVLLDLQLPDIDGAEVLRRLRADPRTAGCRIVALSADAMPDHIQTALAAGFDGYWTKPIHFDRFLAGIDGLAAELTGSEPNGTALRKLSF